MSPGTNSNQTVPTGTSRHQFLSANLRSQLTFAIASVFVRLGPVKPGVNTIASFTGDYRRLIVPSCKQTRAIERLFRSGVLACLLDRQSLRRLLIALVPA